MTEHNENSAFVPVPETGTVVPTSGPAARIRELEAALAKAVMERGVALAALNNIANFNFSISEYPLVQHAADYARTVAQSIEQELKP